ncbi:PAS domain-containing protein [Tunturiibacter psychrotolerans]|uniref:PAS domain-containing protein n=1 Tax=Tunturiibacter psychrotolerans TaxID=3069686 RepID=UPI0033421B86
MNLLHPLDRDHLTANWQSALAAGTYLETEVRFRRADGTYRWFFDRAFPFQSDWTFNLCLSRIRHSRSESHFPKNLKARCEP